MGVSKCERTSEAQGILCSFSVLPPKEVLHVRVERGALFTVRAEGFGLYSGIKWRGAY